MNKLSNQKSNLSPLEENELEWSKIQIDLQRIFGKGIYESWIKKISLKKEYNNYIVLSTPTKFVKDWIVSRYADKTPSLLFL